MALRKTTAGDKIPKAKKASTIKKSEDKVIKRPARGYHKFRNGLLNVAPKGDEKELTKQNRTSPLLRLPPEIRNVIWKLVLGGNVYRTWLCGRLESPSPEPKNVMALLRTCRQVYAEAALMPLTLTIFTTEYIPYAARDLRKLKPQQRRLITFFQMVISHPNSISYHYLKYGLNLAKLLPCLQDLHIRVFEVLHTSTQKVNEERIRKHLEPGLHEKPITIKIEQTDKKWINFNDA
ncbi:unnamed protein product [Alternaria alternata]